MILSTPHRSIGARHRSGILAFAALLIALTPLRFASAMERIKVPPPPPPDGTTTLPMSGTLIRSATTATTTWFLYPGACADRANGTWAPRSTPQADSLNSYTPGSTGPYTGLDQSLSEILWHVEDNALCTPGTHCPAALAGTRMLWCGKFDPDAVQKVGYPNFTYQILYIDTGSHSANYDLTLTYNFSMEFNYDAVYLIGGGGGSVDPIGNSGAACDAVIAAGTELIQWTGSITPGTANATGGNTTGGQVLVSSDPGAPATVTGASFTINASNRALYFVFKSDCFNSNEDGLWSQGLGQQMDNVSTSDNGAIYTDQAPVGGTDAFSGNVILGTPSNPIISARVPPGVGTLWQLVAGINLPTPDTCLPRNTASNLIFEGGNASTFHTVPNQFNSIVSCTFPVPIGTGSIVARWSQYEDLPNNQGYVQFAEYRYFKDGVWSRWRNTFLSGRRESAALQSWSDVRAELAEATQADSVQIRYSVQCVQALAADHNNCGDVIYGVLYDNFRLEMVTGVPAPVFGILSPFTAQSTFVDGTMAG
ncbi:MAG TPA: hypothetical protein VEU09_06990, partial [Candidatus Binatia bacterium]|nr:hypothetical protein [Candidatus Binatia bacterium]